MENQGVLPLDFGFLKIVLRLSPERSILVKRIRQIDKKLYSLIFPKGISLHNICQKSSTSSQVIWYLVAALLMNVDLPLIYGPRLLKYKIKSLVQMVSEPFPPLEFCASVRMHLSSFSLLKVHSLSTR